MKSNIIVGIVIGIVLLGAGLALVFYPKSTSPEAVTTRATTPTNPTTTVTESKTAENVYTLTDVSTHTSSSSCWSVVNGKVYDLTSFINRHEGGSEKIMSICGKDGTAAFTDQHGGKRKPENELTKHYIGNLK